MDKIITNGLTIYVVFVKLDNNESYYVFVEETYFLWHKTYNQFAGRHITSQGSSKSPYKDKVIVVGVKPINISKIRFVYRSGYSVEVNVGEKPYYAYLSEKANDPIVDTVYIN